MNNFIQKTYEDIGAEFATPINNLTEKLKDIKAFVFDWDGVFNSGEKNGNGSSSFNEIDSMGTNLLRFSHYLKHKQLPHTALISGEKNESAFFFTQREHFSASYFKIAHKKWALDHFCSIYSIHPNQVCYFFDDVLDLSIAQQAGLRVLVARKASNLFTNYVKQNKLADYITANQSGNFAVREACEMLMGANETFDETITRRMNYDEVYQQYIMTRDLTPTHFYTYNNRQIINADIKL
jgi:3-deoxy-D-manno-octulosonate 8-phosphate phosphatase (KDO 8-P phosphatase)